MRRKASSRLVLTLKKFFSREARFDFGRRLFETVLVSQLKIGGKEENLQLAWQPTQGQQNVFFPKRLYTSLTSLLSFLEFGACWVGNKMALQQPKPRVVVKRLV